MKNKVLLANECSQSQSRETLREQLEDTLVVLGLAFALETIDPIHVVCLVVSTVQEELLRS